MAASALGRAGFAAASNGGPAAGAGFSKTRVLRVYLGGRPSWPRPDLDVKEEMQRLQAEIDQAPGMEDVTFLGNVMVNSGNPGELTRLLQEHADADGILAVQLCLGTGMLVGILAETDRPTVILAPPYSGHEWCIVPDLQRAGHTKLDVIPTSDMADATIAIRPFRALHRLKETRILLVTGGWSPPATFFEEVKAGLGVDIKLLDPKAIGRAYESIDEKAVEEEARRWTTQAEAIKEPGRKDIVDSSRMSLALQKLLIDEQAQAITINCLGLFGQGVLPAYPCLAFARLNDLGLTGVCEADLASTLTQVIYQHMEGVPGFVTDPVFDLANDAVIHAHCVSATRMDGPAGPQAPYVIRSHLEDNKGASLQVKMRVGQEITMAKLVGSNARAGKPYLAATPAESLGASTMLLSTGKIIGVPDVDRGCRTKISTRVRDARKMLEGWTHGLHRVIFYGNHVADTKRLASYLDIDVVEEG
jgi:hypothetical protein